MIEDSLLRAIQQKAAAEGRTVQAVANELLRQALGAGGIESLPLACWAPVDHCPLPPISGLFFRGSGARPIAMSKFGHRELVEYGIASPGELQEIARVSEREVLAAADEVLKLPKTDASHLLTNVYNYEPSRAKAAYEAAVDAQIQASGPTRK